MRHSNHRKVEQRRNGETPEEIREYFDPPHKCGLDYPEDAWDDREDSGFPDADALREELTLTRLPRDYR